ncbi:acetoacetate decarboxylase [Crossiella equi]|uniref:Acetoacetate decarboxylase n=1 Tax=Crossiella equi TaxID=130796 RepID=A0ABS5ASE6_9PSEU|nr:enduracididine biosynthesis enzyme MppR [Crossiella equi]MBP2479346.1 acetoacetate decarboxylase [Crossiella equi]
MSPTTTTRPTGYSLPLSPSGTSAMLTPPPWHFSGEVVMVDYRVDPAAAAAFLPPGLDPGPDLGAAAAIFAHWQWCSADRGELAEPARGQFGEFLILLSCRAGDAVVARCPFAWVDAPVPMMRGWVQGMPKQFGQVDLSRASTVGLGGPRLAAGETFAGTLSVHGQRAARLSVELIGETAAAPLLHTVPLAHSLHFPTWTGEQPAPERLVASEVDGVEFGPVWTGAATLDLYDVLGPDYASLAPVEVGAGHVFAYAETLHGGRLLGQG